MSPFTDITIINWLSHVAESTNRFAATIRTYRSAISTLHAESEWGHLPNPAQSIRVGRFMTGLERERAPYEALVRRSRLPTVDVTGNLLCELEPISRGNTPHTIMCWAAATLGTFAILRIGELIATRLNSDRFLKVDQIKFYRDEDGRTLVGLLAPGVDIDKYEKPDHFKLHLGATKTDQLGRGTTKVVGAGLGVRAMWRWMHLRRDMEIKYSRTTNELFRVPGADSLTVTQVISHIQDGLESKGRGRPKITGKGFRRGGASTLVGGNTPAADAAAAGGWKSIAMLDTYANREAKERRALAVSKKMAP